MTKIPLIKPYINSNIKDRVLNVLESGYLTEGPVTREFEKKIAEYLNVKHAIAVTSCTTGLELALRVLKIGKGDEVIVPDYTYPATASVVNIVGAQCVIVDVDPNTMLIDYDALERAITSKTRAIIPVSLFGNPLNYNKLNKIKKKYNLFIIEDAACSLGAKYNGIKVGKLADISVFSFHPRKFITTGEGGIITTDNDQWAEWINSYKHFGMNNNSNSREAISFEIPGTNYKLTDIQSAIGLGQLEHIGMLLERRRILAKQYNSLLQNVAGIKLPLTTVGGKHSYQSYCILVSSRNRIMNELRSIGIEVQIGTYALHMHKAFQNKDYFKLQDNLKWSKYVFDHCLTLPLFHELTLEEQIFIVDNLKKLL
jgi:dTDP-4-amino-4,6-dideoxygalactose transaminase